MGSRYFSNMLSCYFSSENWILFRDVGPLPFRTRSDYFKPLLQLFWYQNSRGMHIWHKCLFFSISQPLVTVSCVRSFCTAWCPTTCGGGALHLACALQQHSAATGTFGRETRESIRSFTISSSLPAKLRLGKGRRISMHMFMENSVARSSNGNE